MLQSLALFQIASTVNNNVNNFNNVNNVNNFIPNILRTQSIFWDLKAFLRSRNNLKDLKPLDLEIALLAHHLRPIFGLVFYCKTKDLQQKHQIPRKTFTLYSEKISLAVWQTPPPSLCVQGHPLDIYCGKSQCIGLTYGFCQPYICPLITPLSVSYIFCSLISYICYTLRFSSSHV